MLQFPQRLHLDLADTLANERELLADLLLARHTFRITICAKPKPPGALPMPKAYWISAYRQIKDPAKLAAYAALAPPATSKFGAKYLCRGLPQAVYEAGEKERIVITEFPSLKDAIAAHDSPGYQKALEALGDGAVRDIRIIEGLE
jgi:uncharacterized protein (DUF1330 family)